MLKLISKKVFVIILVLSVVVTYGMAIAESIMNPDANQSGIPFKFGTYTLFGKADTNYLMLLLNIVFWFVIILIIWKSLNRIIKIK